MGVNIENLNALIAHMENAVPDEKFNMANIFTSVKSGSQVERYTHCKTAACIAGWAYVVAPVEARRRRTHWLSGHWRTAEKWLGLTATQADRLFSPSGYWHAEDYPRARAIAVLKHLRETGEVNWDRFPDYVKADAP